jgi:hypothetical protein
MAPRLITPVLADRYRAALDALSAAHRGAGTGQPDWWRGVADAHQQVADVLDGMVEAMLAARLDAPDYVVREIVSRAAADHTLKAQDAAAKQADADARARRNQDRAYASYADNVRATDMDPLRAYVTRVPADPATWSGYRSSGRDEVA